MIALFWRRPELKHLLKRLALLASGVRPPHRDSLLYGFTADCAFSSCEAGGMRLEVNQDAGYSETDRGKCLEF